MHHIHWFFDFVLKALTFSTGIIGVCSCLHRHRCGIAAPQWFN